MMGLEMICSEMETYANYVQEDLPRLYIQILELKAEISEDTFGVSSPRIKSSAEAKYQSSPKVYIEDAALQRMARRDDKLIRLQPLEMEYAMKRIFVIMMQKRIINAALSDEEKRLVWYRFFKRYPLRAIARVMNSNKDSVRKGLRRVLERL